MNPHADNGLRKVLIWTLIAFVLAVVLAMIGANVAIRYFDTTAQSPAGAVTTARAAGAVHSR